MTECHRLSTAQSAGPKLPKPVGLLVLIGLRNILRQRNLYDTSACRWRSRPTSPADPRDPHRADTPTAPTTTLRSPAMGMAGTRFGRNVPLQYGYQEAPDEILDPNPA